MNEAASVGIPRGDLVTLAVVGEDAQTWLQGLATNDVASLEAGEGSWGLFLTKPGKVLCDALFLRTPEALLLGVPKVRAEALWDHLDEFLVMEDAEIASRPGQLWVMALGALAGGAAEAAVALVPGWYAGKLGWTDGPGAVAVGPAEGIADVRRALEGAGLHWVDEAGARRARIERFLPEFGVDYDVRQNPHEASLERVVVDWDKGCYLGQEAVCMLDMRGKVKRRLVTVAVDGVAPAVGAELRDPFGNVVGSITSVSASEEGAVAFARVAAGSATAGAELRLGDARACVLRAPPRRE